MEELHVADVVDEEDLLEDDDQAFPVHLDRDHHSVECEFAYCRVFLSSPVSPMHITLASSAAWYLPYLRVDYP